MATSYNGWTASRYPSAIGINAKWAPLGHDFPGGIKSGDVEKVFTDLVVQLDTYVEPIEWYGPGDEWGYSYRPSKNSPNVLSCHASGTAIDYNATRHPNGKRNTFTAAQVTALRSVLARYDGVIRWGGDFSTVPDEMHFEIRGTAAQVAAVAKKLETPPSNPTPPTPSPIVGIDPLEVIRVDPLAVVNFNYTNVLGRKPESIGAIAFHLDLVKAYGMDWSIGYMINSPEGMTRWAHGGGVNATHFGAVLVAFHSILDRHPGYDVNALTWGAGRVAAAGLGGFMTELIQSPEGQQRYGA